MFKSTETNQTNSWSMLDQPVYNAAEVCKILRISRTSLWRITKSGYLRKLQAQGQALFPRSELIRYLEASQESGNVA
ncbi:helix-turn-helix domain-containing protein [Pelagicoccus mobilis]|uniref:Helix-turn-helix domain-containing protein n=1 Tax=Pelagicoccus mobilis TaxID=415221 RepID=A0A934S3U8_9BACT|nr:helix-turn-helix domain-containing protein [Pelagicoccus mobilis]MBK1880201.1 helix-turn-helix domain-containing protein [Pelagicoccus mobilis]